MADQQKTRGRDRRTLTNYFRGGALPTADHYKDLIDSTVNKVDDGFDKTPKDGLILRWLDDTNLMSFYGKTETGEAAWRVAHDPEPNNLHFVSRRHETPSVVMGPGQLGVNVDTPRAALDVNGVVRAGGRLGQPLAVQPLEASRGWQTLVDDLTGCHAFEVVAGVGGGKGTGRYALVHAICVNAYNPVSPFFGWLFPNRRKPIHATHSSYGRYNDRLELRWKTHDLRRREYSLQIRSRCPFKGKVFIQAYVTRLWFDETMEHAQEAQGQPQFEIAPGKPQRRRPPQANGSE